MATNIKTVITYTLDGSTTDFAIPFEYLARKFVQVTLIGVDRSVLVLNQDYRFTTKAIISTTKAWGTTDGYQQIEIRRYTSASERLVDFTDGSILRAYDLNIAQIQTLHVAEEARDLTADTIGVNSANNLDARGRRIVNLADGVDDGDAISVGQVKRMNQNSWLARNEAQGFRNEALQFRNEAETFKTQSSDNAQNTLKWRNESEQFRNQAATSQSAAKGSQDAAALSASQAATSSDQAATSAATAKTEADRSTTEADRAKTEADKLGNMNAFAGAIDKVEGYDVTFKGQLISPTKVTAKEVSASSGLTVGGNAAVKGSASVSAGLNVNSYLTVGNGSQSSGALHLQGDGILQDGNQSAALNQLSRLNINGPTVYSAKSGLHIGWNDSNSKGESNFVSNQGDGDGGFIFRTVDQTGSTERGRVEFTQDGTVVAKGVSVSNAYAGSFQISGGYARLQSNSDIVGATLYAGNGTASYQPNGNVVGQAWGGNLYDYLNNNSLFAKPPSGVQLFTGRGSDYLQGSVDGTTVGFRWFSSDRRLKEDIKVVRDDADLLAIIRSYTPFSYKYKDSTYTDSSGREITITGKRSRAGFITQDLIQLWPEAVDVMSDGMQSPDPNQIIGGLMLLVRNLDARVQELEKKKKNEEET